MTNEPARMPSPVEVIPSVAGGISGIASASAPFVYFDSVNFYGIINGVGQVTLEANRLMATGPMAGSPSTGWLSLTSSAV